MDFALLLRSTDKSRILVFAKIRKWLAQLSPDQLTDIMVRQSSLFEKFNSFAEDRVIFLPYLALNKLVFEQQSIALGRFAKFPVLPSLVTVIQVLADLQERIERCDHLPKPWGFN